MRKIFCFLSIVIFSSCLYAFKPKHAFKKAAKYTGLSAAVHAASNITHESKKIINNVNTNVTKPIVKETKNIVNIVNENVTQPVMDSIVKPVISETKNIVSVVDKNVIKQVVNNVKPIKMVKHELSKISQPCLKPAEFFLDTLIEIQKKVVDHNLQEILKATHLEKEFHILIKCVNEVPKLSKAAGFLLATGQDPFAAVIDYFLPLPISGITVAADVIENTHIIEDVTKVYNSIIDKIEVGDVTSMSGLTINEYATLLLKNELVEEREQAVMLLTITKDIGKGIESTIDWIAKSRIKEVPRHWWDDWK